MRKILNFLIRFINDTDLEDHIELTYEPDGENPDIIIIKRIKDEDNGDA